jgi:hypothetical protein
VREAVQRASTKSLLHKSHLETLLSEKVRSISPEISIDEKISIFLENRKVDQQERFDPEFEHHFNTL